MFLIFLYKGENIHNNVHFVEINSTEIVIILISRQRRRKREKERVTYRHISQYFFNVTLSFNIIFRIILITNRIE